MDSVQIACDEKTKDGFVRVIMNIPNLKYSRVFTPCKFVKKARNADISEEFGTETFKVTIIGKQNGQLKGKNYQLHIKKLIYPINPDACYVEADENRALVFLKKAENISWYPELHDGLESVEPEEQDNTV